MQILANALPGFRDLRGPVIAGYLWILFGWLLVQPDLDDRPSNDLGAAVFELAERIGPIGIGVAASVGAYLVGAVSQEANPLLTRLARLSRALARIEVGFGGLSMSVDLTERVSQRTVDQVADLNGQAVLVVESAGLDDLARLQILDELASRREAALREATRELELPATLLVGDRPELFAEVDRLRAEGELRLAVIPPLAFLIGLLAVESSLWWLCAVGGLVLLLRQGVQRSTDSRKLIADAMRRGLVKSSGIGQFSEWVAALPQEIERTVEALRDPPKSPGV